MQEDEIPVRKRLEVYRGSGDGLTAVVSLGVGVETVSQMSTCEQLMRVQYLDDIPVL